MDLNAIATQLNSLTDKQFIEFFYRSLAARNIYGSEYAYIESHLVLASATRMQSIDEWGPWEMEMLCTTPDAWVDDAPVCQQGAHCGVETISWAKRSVCPMCGGEVLGT